MAADSANDLELSLKKRARRRLVGAIALVLLMVIVLPMVLQDRSSTAQQESIKITMPDDIVTPVGEKPSANVAESIESQVAPSEPVTAVDMPTEVANVASSEADNTPKSDPQAVMADAKPALEKAKKPEETAKEKVEPKKDKPEVVKPVPVKPVEKKPAEAKPTADKPATPANGSFTIQVGVFSDPENVKQLQAKLKQVGLASRTEKITTPKGEKIRLKAGTFTSREEAAYALTKVNAADLTGMVISNN